MTKNILAGQWVQFVCGGCLPGGHSLRDSHGYGRVGGVSSGVITVSCRGQVHHVWYPDRSNSRDRVSEVGLAETAFLELAW